ncbi:MAG: hypothetical protein ACRCVX_00600 [Shewanella sp.]
MPAPVVTPAQLVDIPSSERYDGMPMLVRLASSVVWFYFDANSTSIAVPNLVYVPTAGSGRYHVIDRDSAALAALVDNTTVTPNAKTTSNFTLGLTAAVGESRFIAAPENIEDGQQIRIWLQQPLSPPVGGCKITLANIWQPRGGIALNPQPGGISLLQGQYAFGKILCEIGGW